MLYVFGFFDIEKAFDIVNREVLCHLKKDWVE